MLGPLEQFEISNVIAIPVSLGLNNIPCLQNWKFCHYGYILSNLTLMFFCSNFLIFNFYYILFIQNKIIPFSWQIIYHKYFLFIEQIIRDLITTKTGKIYYVNLFIVLFIFINFVNLIGLIPYSFAITSHFSVTFTLAFFFFLTLNLTGILYHGIHILNLFFPTGTPLIIIPLLVIIEFISYFARVSSLAIRLFANITAGHILLKILAWFTYLLIDIFFFSFIGFLIICALWVSEFFTSILQAYVFLTLLCIYLGEVLQLH